MFTEEELAKLQQLKKELDPDGTADSIYVEDDEDVIYREEDQEELQRELMKQHEVQQQSGGEFDDFFHELTGPVSEEKEDVEVQYYGGVIKAYVNISFDELSPSITQERYDRVREALKQFGQAKTDRVRLDALQQIEDEGEDIVEVIYRECRLFTLVSQVAFDQMVQLIGRLSYRHLHNRLLMKGILEQATSEQHIRLAIAVAGVLRDQESADAVERHLSNDALMLQALSTLFKIRRPSSVPAILRAFASIPSTRKDLIDASLEQAKSFYKFGIDVYPLVFDAYMTCDNRMLRPIFIFAVRSFGDEGLPHLKKVLPDYMENGEIERVRAIISTIGGLRTVAAYDALVEMVHRTSDEYMKRALVDGIAMARNKEAIPAVLDILNRAETPGLQSACLHALSNFGYEDDKVKEAARRFLRRNESNLNIDAMNCLIRNGELQYFEPFMELAVNGDDVQKNVAAKCMTRFPAKLIEKVGAYLERVTPEQGLHLVTTLQRKNYVPRSVGDVLQRQLERDLPDYYKVEIYRLLAKHAGTPDRLIPDEALFQALDEAEQSPSQQRLARELKGMVRTMKGNSGTIVVKGDKRS